MISSTAIAAITCVLGAFPAGGPQTIAEVVEAVRMGDFRRAQALVEAESDPLGRAQAECYLRHHAGDLVGAHAAARQGLAHDSGDPWLLERATYIALTLRDAPAAHAYLARLEAASRDSRLGTGDDPQGWRAAASSHRRDLTELSRDLSERDSAVLRARTISGAAVALVLCGLVFLARRGR